MATFSEAMDPTSINVNSFTLEKKVGVVAVATGNSHTVALKGDGTVVAWGSNAYGETNIPVGLTGVVAVAAGGVHTVALKDDGTVVAWGQFSVPGEFDYEIEFIPAYVPDGLSNVVAIAAGKHHAVALKRDGTVVAWGGDGRAGQKTIPTGLKNVVAIAAGGFHTVALKNDGSVLAWGGNNYLENGLSCSVPDISYLGCDPYQYEIKIDYGQTIVPAGLGDVAAITAGKYYTAALKKNGTVVAWGDSRHGQIAVPAGLSSVAALAAGSDHTIALKVDGTVVTWGDNSRGQIAVPTGLSTVAAIAAGGTHTVALKSDGTVVAWGDFMDVGCTFDYNACSYESAWVPADLGDVVAVEASVTYSGPSRLANLTPQSPLLLNAVYRATVFGRSVSGVPMAGGDQWLFSTGESVTSFLVTPKAGPYGKITPAIGQLAISGTTTSFTLTPDAGCMIDTVTGCGGALVGNTYTTGPIIQACTVTAAFRPVPPSASSPPAMSVPLADPDGNYTVSWGASTTAGVTYELQEASNIEFTTDLRTINAGTVLSTTIAGRSQNKNYTYRVRAIKSGYIPSPWRYALNRCSVPGSATVGTPGSLVVPAVDADGNYTVSWGASATAGVIYELREATNSTHTMGDRYVYRGSATSFNVTGRSQNVTYYYRVYAIKGGLLDSPFRNGTNGCAVPGTSTAVAPATLTVPMADTDGAYVVSWGVSAITGVTYELQEATSSNFSTGLRNVYRGTGLFVNITGRSQNVTYYYRVRAVKAGLKDSGYRLTMSGCAVPGTSTAVAPASLTVPVADADGAYPVSWGASTTGGVTYELQEATSSNFSTGLRNVYRGAALTTNITGRSQNVTYYYRVRAVKAGLKDSGYRGAANSCAVPGTATAGVPASLTVPATDADGAYTVSWGASATPGVTYELQEATNNIFTAGLRLAYRGTARTANITGRVVGTTYYYRVRAVKGGLKDSGYRMAVSGCRIGL